MVFPQTLPWLLQSSASMEIPKCCNHLFSVCHPTCEQVPHHPPKALFHEHHPTKYSYLKCSKLTNSIWDYLKKITLQNRPSSFSTAPPPPVSGSFFGSITLHSVAFVPGWLATNKQGEKQSFKVQSIWMTFSLSHIFWKLPWRFPTPRFSAE